MLGEVLLTSVFFAPTLHAQYRYEWQQKNNAPDQVPMYRPEEVALDQLGNVYVTDYGRDRILKFSPAGQLLLNIGSGNGQLEAPLGVAIDGEGNIYATDTNGGVKKFDANGRLLLKINLEGQPDGGFNYGVRRIALDGQGNIYVTDFKNYNVQKFDASGRLLLKFGAMGSGMDGYFMSPMGIAVDGQGNIYVADLNGDRIQKFNAEGQFLLRIGTRGLGEGQLWNPSSVAVDQEGKIYIVDLGGMYVQKFDAAGHFLVKFGTGGSAEGQFMYPSGIAVDGQGNVYVADNLNDRIQKFSPAPCAPIALSPGTLPAAAIGAPYSATLTGAPARYTYSAAGLPAGLSMSSTGVISGTPTAGAPSVPVTITAAFDRCSQSVEYALPVHPGTAAVSLAGLHQTYSGTARPVAVTTTPAGLVTRVTYDGSPVVPCNAGTYAVAATVVSADYTGTATATLTISKAPLVAKAVDLSKVYGDPNPALALTYSGLVNGETEAVLDAMPTASTPAVPASNAGTYPITLSGGHDDNYAFTLQPGTMTVTKAGQRLTFESLPGKTFGDAPFALSATATSGLAVAFSSSDPAVAAVSGNTLTIAGAGTVTITASQAGNDNYGPAASVSRSFTVAKANQAIAFAALPGKKETDEPFTLTAAASSGLAVAFRVLTGPAVLMGNVVTLTGTGQVTIEAAQDGNARYAAAPPEIRTFCVEPVKPVVTAHGVTLHSSRKTGNQWYLDGVLLPGETGHVLVVRTTGTYTVSAHAPCGQSLTSDAFSVGANPIADAGTLYPNPATDKLALEFPREVMCSSVKVFDAHGKEVASQPGQDKNSILLDVSGFRKGVYYLEAQTTGGVTRHRFILQ